MRKYILTLLFIGGCINLFSQKIDFDMNSYKTPDLLQHSLKINLDSRVNFNENNLTKTYTDSLGIEDQEHSETYSNNNSSGGIDLFYSLKIDLKRRYHYLNIYSNFSCRNSSSNSNSDIDFYYGFKTKRNYDNEIYRFNNNLRVDSNNKFYLKDKPLFLGADFSTNLSYNRTDDSRMSEYFDPDIIDAYSGDIYRKKINLYSKISLGQGKINTTKYIRIAISIIQELQDNNLLKKKPTNDEITKLADFLIEVNNKKFFISSDRKKYQIEQIVKFFLDKNLINLVNHRFFSILYDNWFNEYSSIYYFAYLYNFPKYSYNIYYRTNLGAIRGSGQLIEFGIGYSSDYNKTAYNAIFNHTTYQDTIQVENSSYKRNEKDIATSPYIFIQAEKHKCHGLDIQSNLYFQISYSQYSDENQYNKIFTENEELSDSIYFSQLESSNQLIAETNYSLSWFLSKRSIIGISNTIYYSNIIGEKKLKDDDNYQDFTQFLIGSSITLRGAYYISPQVKLSTSASILFQNELYEEETFDDRLMPLFMDFSFRVEYYIF